MGLFFAWWRFRDAADCSLRAESQVIFMQGHNLVPPRYGALFIFYAHPAFRLRFRSPLRWANFGSRLRRPEFRDECSILPLRLCCPNKIMLLGRQAMNKQMHRSFDCALFSFSSVSTNDALRSG
jgi:hypothetical protein